MDLQKVKCKVVVGKKKGQEMFTLRRVNYGGVSYEKLLEEISNGSTFSSGDADAILKNFFEVVFDEVANGHAVEMGVLGTLNPRITAKTVDTPDECKADTISRIGIHYKPSVSLDEAAKTMSMQVCYFSNPDVDDTEPDDDIPDDGGNDNGDTEPGNNNQGGGSSGGGDLEG